jgi:hypothetical protein
MLTRAVSYVQLAGVVLKGYINAHWDSADVKFVEPQTTPQDKVRLAPAPLLYLCTPWVGLHDDRSCAFGRRPSVRHCPRDSLIPRARSVRRRYCTSLLALLSRVARWLTPTALACRPWRSLRSRTGTGPANGPVSSKSSVMSPPLLMVLVRA